MKTVKLSTALKIKNRLAGELVRLNTILARSNSTDRTRPPQHDLQSIWDKIAETSGKLAEVKSAITVANIGIYPRLAKMEEIKSSIAFLGSLDTKEGVYRESEGFRGNVIERTYDAFLTQKEVDSLTSELQKLIDDLQDEVDEYNHSHLVDLPI